MHKKHSNFQQLNHEDERRIVEFLANRKAAEDSLNQKLKAWLERHYHSFQNQDSNVNQITSQDSGFFDNLDNKYPDYPEEKELDETNNGAYFSKDLEYGRTFDVNRGRAMEEPVVNTFHKYINHNPAGIFLHHESGRETTRPASPAAEAIEPEFTYSFDNPNLEEKHPFAVAPNDLRYFDAPFSSGKHSHRLILLLIVLILKSNASQSILAHEILQRTQNSIIIADFLSIHASSLSKVELQVFDTL